MIKKLSSIFLFLLSFSILSQKATHLNFDGLNDYVQLSNESSFDFTNQMTVEFWLNSDITPEQWDALVVKGDNSWRVSLNDAGQIAFTGTDAFVDFFLQLQLLMVHGIMWL